MADSRGLTRLYEQGAIFYVVIGSYPDAYKARNTELSLIKSSLAESIRKKQKEEILKSQFDTQKELKEFANILNLINPEYTKGIKSNLNIFTFGKNDVPLVKPLKKSEPISGTIKAIFGKYLILENSGRFYGLWVDDLYGKQIEISQELSLIEPEPEQAFLL